MKQTHKKLSKAELFRMLGYTPRPGQRVIHLSDAPRRVVACGARFGKTLAASMEALAAALQPAERTIGWIVAPTYDLANRVFSQIVLTAASHLRHRIVSSSDHEHRIVIRNMGGGLSEIRCKSADNPTSLLGEGLDFVIVDEASRLKPAIWQSHLSQRLIDKRGWALLITTPRGKGWLYELYRRGQGPDPDYESWNMPSWENPLLPAGWVETERSRLPDQVFRQEFGGEFLEGAGAVFRHVRERALLDWQEPVKGELYFAGLDLAKVNDYSVLVILNRHGEVAHVDRFHKLDWALQIARIKAAASRYNRAKILVDSTGIGEPIYEELARAGCNVEPYLLGAKSKSDLVTNLSVMFENAEITLPKADLWPQGIDELESFQYSVTDAGGVKTGAPSGINDDCVIALALAAWQVKNRPARPRFYGANSLEQLQQICRRIR